LPGDNRNCAITPAELPLKWNKPRSDEFKLT
jgi:hypothetical protein